MTASHVRKEIYRLYVELHDISFSEARRAVDILRQHKTNQEIRVMLEGLLEDKRKAANE